MATTLFSFLGRVPKDENAYRTTRYDFGDGALTEPVAYFGWPLTKRINPNRLVIMGTSGSMWDHLFEVDYDFGDQYADQRLELTDATENHAVKPIHLAPLEPLLTKALGCEVKLRLIPYCRDESEQVEILRLLSLHVARDDLVHIDITHGFRTIPMLSVLAALYLRRVRRAEVAGIWYGFYDRDTENAPVHDLKGLLHIADWLEALAIYDRTGDYGYAAQMIGHEGELLCRAAFFERSSNPVKAREALTGWYGRADRTRQGDPATELFVKDLDRRVAWRRGADRGEWERTLARTYLDKRDYVRAAIYGMEAIITAEALICKDDPQNRNDRDRLHENLRRNCSEYRDLSSLRNALAHGQRSLDRNIRSTMDSEPKLQASIRALFERLF